MKDSSITPASTGEPRRIEPIDGLSAFTAEYNAVATRINTFIALQFVPWPPLAVVLALVVNALKGQNLETDTATFVTWSAVIAVQVAVMVYSFALYEVYNHVRYVETELRPRISEIIHVDSNWGYEKFLTKTGKANNPNSGDRYVLLVSAIAIVFAIYLKWNCGLASPDGILAELNLLIFYWSTGMVDRVVTARERLFIGVAA